MKNDRPFWARWSWSCIGAVLVTCGSGAIAAASTAISRAPAPNDPAAAGESLPTAEARSLYTLGQLISRTLETFSLTPQELEWVKSGLDDGVLRRPPRVDLAAEATGLPALQEARRAATLERERSAGAAFLSAALQEPGVQRHASGFVMQPLAPGHGEQPSALDHVRVHYEGMLIDGTVFESSRDRTDPATLPVRGVIPCWSEALQSMRVGGRSRLICPAELAYGDRGSPPAVRPGATLVFDIELLGVVR
jgi:FKBP-type peptidyl-prolyl cis-trans isomerase FkpA/FKBP-type peptidyl-prolyl cis-trans isomerase FklB